MLRPGAILKAILPALLALGLLARAPAAQADTLTSTESSRLTHGETVIREHTWEPGYSARYIGGVTYTVVDATAPETSGLLEDVATFRRVLPQTKRVRLVSIEPNGDRLVELVQGNALVEATYTLRVRTYPARREVRFWLETKLPHEIDDAFGYFRVEPYTGSSGEPQTLLTYAILVDIGPGIVRDLFEERVRAALLSVPQLVRRYVAEVRHP
ncbi:MAG: hypothetical protein JWO86_7383 [Myxococcaceae bacterium]|nr:hypothetical protein [Myxococcaceae bacterium]MEA2751071.1 hypothetical protein [Myxococcales bacterium]